METTIAVIFLHGLVILFVGKLLTLDLLPLFDLRKHPVLEFVS